MGLFERIRQKERIETKVKEYFELINSYTPAFKTYEGGLYEMELTRAAVRSFATHASKLQPEVKGPDNDGLRRALKFRPNPIMDTAKYLERLATVYEVANTAIIAPMYDRKGDIVGYYPLDTSKCRIVDYEGRKYIQYEFFAGQRGAIELDRAGIMTQMQLHDEIFGEGNTCLQSTLELLNINSQGMVEGVKQGAAIRFMAKLAQTLKEKDIEAERQRLVKNNLSIQNSGGVLMFDQKYDEIKQITSQPYTVNPDQVKIIKDNVFEYFGTNEKILTNSFTSSEWNAYYEGKIEPFAVKAGLVHTNMTFSWKELAYGNEIQFTSNRLQYMSASEKVQMVSTLFDRGFISLNDGREIFNMTPVEGGDQRYIRKEYINTKDIDKYIAEGGSDYAGTEDQGIQNDFTAVSSDGTDEEET